MSALITSKGRKIIVVVMVIGVVALILTYFFGPAARQAQNLALAREHASRIEPEIHRDPRFKDVKLGGYTGDGGCLWVIATLDSDGDSNDLHQLVEASHPPVRAHYDITVLPRVDEKTPQ
jgi:hypothetical protein